MPRSPTHAVQAAGIEHHLVAALYDQTLQGTVASLLVAVLLSGLLFGQVSTSSIAIWLAGMFLVACVRFAHWRLYRKAGGANADNAHHWKRWHVALIVLPGTIWGCGGAYFFGQLDAVHQTIIVFVLGGLSVAAIPYLSSVLSAYVAYVVPLQLPLQLTLLAAGQTAPVSMAAMLFIFTILLLLTAFHHRKKLVESLTLRYQNSTLVERLEAYRQQLEQKVDALEDVNRELESFNYSVSHDLRAPLLTINGFTRVLEEDHSVQLEDKARAALQRIREASERMSEVIDALQQLSRISRQTMVIERTDLSRISRNIMSGFESDAPERRCVVTVQPDLYVNSDPALMSVLMENLLSNAWKYTRSRSCARIEVGCLNNDSRSVYFVADNGVGFESRHASRLFKPFERLHHASEYEGNGIGLATVARIVRRHHGSIWVETKPERGATFYFVLNEVSSDTNSRNVPPAN